MARTPAIPLRRLCIHSPTIACLHSTIRCSSSTPPILFPALSPQMKRSIPGASQKDHPFVGVTSHGGGIVGELPDNTTPPAFPLNVGDGLAPIYQQQLHYTQAPHTRDAIPNVNTNSILPETFTSLQTDTIDTRARAPFGFRPFHHEFDYPNDMSHRQL